MCMQAYILRERFSKALPSFLLSWRMWLSSSKSRLSGRVLQSQGGCSVDRGTENSQSTKQLITTHRPQNPSERLPEHGRGFKESHLLFFIYLFHRLFGLSLIRLSDSNQSTENRLVHSHAVRIAIRSAIIGRALLHTSPRVTYKWKKNKNVLPCSPWRA